MKRFLVRDISTGRVRLIEADSFTVEESGYNVFYDEDSNLLARFINVEVEPWSESRETGDEVASIAGAYLDFGPKDLQVATINAPDKLCMEIRKMAASCLSQVEGGKAKKK